MTVTTDPIRAIDVPDAIAALQMLQECVLSAIRNLTPPGPGTAPPDPVPDPQPPRIGEPSPVEIIRDPTSASFRSALETILTYSSKALSDLGGKLPPLGPIPIPMEPLDPADTQSGNASQS
jgi:hypothetical protein